MIEKLSEKIEKICNGQSRRPEREDFAVRELLTC